MNALELKVPPPLVVLVTALLMWLTPAAAGLVPIPHAARVLCAFVLACAGFGITFAGLASFRRAETTVSPVEPQLASSLVMRGIYRHTRNPMYLGFLVALLGWAVFLVNPLNLLWVVAFALYIARFQIVPQERVLASLFGSEYAAYRGRVRRWV